MDTLVLGKFVVSSDCHSRPAELLDDRVSFGIKQLQHAKYGILTPIDDVIATVQDIEMFTDTHTITFY